MTSHRRDLSKEPPLMSMSPADYPNLAKCKEQETRPYMCDDAYCPKHSPEVYVEVAKHYEGEVPTPPEPNQGGRYEVVRDRRYDVSFRLVDTKTDRVIARLSEEIFLIRLRDNLNAEDSLRDNLKAEDSL